MTQMNDRPADFNNADTSVQVNGNYASLSAEELIKRAQDGEPEAFFEMGERIYSNPIKSVLPIKGFTIRCVNAYINYSHSAELGYKPAIHKIIQMIESDELPYSIWIFHEWLLEIAENCSSELHYRLGQRYHFGYCTDVNFNQAEKWYLKAVQNGHESALLYLVKLYLDQDSSSINSEKLLTLINSVADRGSAVAHYLLGNIYSHASCVKFDLGYAFNHYMAAIRLGSTIAYNELNSKVCNIIRKKYKKIEDFLQDTSFIEYVECQFSNIYVRNHFSELDAEYISKTRNILDELETFFPSNKIIDPCKVESVLSLYPGIYDAVKKRVQNPIFIHYAPYSVKKSLNHFLNMYEMYFERVKQTNLMIAADNAKDIGILINPIEKNCLDLQQLTSIALDIRTRLVVAGAGTGKTTTIVGFVKYLVKQMKINPEKIELLSFTEASVNELKLRIFKETNVQMNVQTFHSLGRSIIVEARGNPPTVLDLGKKDLGEMLQDLCKDYEYLLLVTDYLKFYYARYEERMTLYRNIETLAGDKVKSYGEKEIADFLYTRGIRYMYEEPYEYEVSSNEHSQYRPDFHI